MLIWVKLELADHLIRLHSCLQLQNKPKLLRAFLMPRQIHWNKATLYGIYRVSQKKCPYVFNCHNSIKIGTRNKSRVSFEILRKSSCWWALKFFNFDFWGLSKWGLKLVTLHQKAWPNQTFSVPVFSWHKWNWNTLVFHMNISLLWSWTISMIFFCGWGREGGEKRIHCHARVTSYRYLVL